MLGNEARQSDIDILSNNLSLLQGIPEEYFKEFIGNKNEYYIKIFKKISAILDGNSSAKRKLLDLIVTGDNPYGIICLFLGFTPFFLYRKMFYWAIIWILLSILYMYLFYNFEDLALIKWSWYIFNVIIASVFNILYYNFCRNKIKSIIYKSQDTKDISNELAKSGRTEPILLYFSIGIIILLFLGGIMPVTITFMNSQ